MQIFELFQEIYNFQLNEKNNNKTIKQRKGIAGQQFLSMLEQKKKHHQTLQTKIKTVNETNFIESAQNDSKM